MQAEAFLVQNLGSGAAFALDLSATTLRQRPKLNRVVEHVRVTLALQPGEI